MLLPGGEEEETSGLVVVDPENGGGGVTLEVPQFLSSNVKVRFVQIHIIMIKYVLVATDVTHSTVVEGTVLTLVISSVSEPLSPLDTIQSHISSSYYTNIEYRSKLLFL